MAHSGSIDVVLRNDCAVYRPYSQRAQLVVLNSGPSLCQLSGYKFKLQLDSDLLARVSSQATQAGGILVFAKPQ